MAPVVLVTLTLYKTYMSQKLHGVVGCVAQPMFKLCKTFRKLQNLTSAKYRDIYCVL